MRCRLAACEDELEGRGMMQSFRRERDSSVDYSWMDCNGCFFMDDNWRDRANPKFND